jgi:hypothetical protein
MSVARNIPIARKFAIAFGLVCVLCISLGAFNFFTFRGIDTVVTEMDGDSLPSLIEISHMQATANTWRRNDLDLLLCQAAACTADHLAQRQKAVQEFDAANQIYKPHLDAGMEAQLYQNAISAMDRYRILSDRGAAMASEGKMADALDALGSNQSVQAFGDTMQVLQGLSDFNVK